MACYREPGRSQIYLRCVGIKCSCALHHGTDRALTLSSPVRKDLHLAPNRAEESSTLERCFYRVLWTDNITVTPAPTVDQVVFAGLIPISPHNSPERNFRPALVLLASGRPRD